MTDIRSYILALPLILLATMLPAQGANVAFGSVAIDPTLPVEMTADTLDVNQSNGSAEFTGDVLIIQGEMRLSAQRVLVVYNQEQGGIKRLEASGHVILVSGPDAAEADSAIYTIKTGAIVMSGNVLLTQGQNALTSQNMTINLIAGTAKMSGRVKTILNPAKN